MSARIDDLMPSVVSAAMSAIDELTSRKVSFTVTSTLRTVEEQLALYAQGRVPITKVNLLRSKAHMRPITDSENKYIVTNADGVKAKSKHQSGRALDVVPSENGKAVWPPKSDGRWDEISRTFKNHGFRWGGDWKDFEDFPHYQM